MKVLIVAANASAKWGGEAVLPLHIFRGLRAAGHEAWLCVGKETKPELDELLGDLSHYVEYVEDTQRHDRLRKLEAKLPRWLGTHPLYFFYVLITQMQQRRNVLRLIEKFGIEVVHQPTPVSPKAPSFLTKLPVPLVIGPMNGGMEYPDGFRFLERAPERIVRRVGRVAFVVLNQIIAGKREAACLLVANERTREALPPRLPGKVEHIVENGVDPGIWKPTQNLAPRTDGLFELLFMGRLVPWKGADWLLDAMVGVAQRVKCRLRIVGDFKEERIRLENRARELGLAGSVEFLGWKPQDACAELLQQSDALVLPSVFECGGAVVLEAMASSKAVIAIDWGGPADYLDETCGILVPATDPKRMASGLEDAIVALANDRARCRQMGIAGREKVLAQFAWPAKIRQFVQVYDSVLASKHKA